MCRGCHHVFTVSQDTAIQSPLTISPEAFAFACPQCSYLFEGRSEMAGRKGKCTECEHVFLIQKYVAPVGVAAAVSVAVLTKPSAEKLNPNTSPHPPTRQPNQSVLTSVPRVRPIPPMLPSAPSDNSICNNALADLPPVSIANTKMDLHSTNPYAVVSQTNNPYAASSVSYISEMIGIGSAEDIRSFHLSHEGAIKSFGALFILGAAGLVIGGAFMFALAVSQILNPDSNAPQGREFTLLGIAMFYVCFSAGQGYAAWGLRTLNPSGRIIGTVWGAIGLIEFPLGTLMSIYLLYLLWSKKGATVFSEPYKDVILATPHIKYKTSIIVWVFVGILVLFLLLALAAAVFLPK